MIFERSFVVNLSPRETTPEIEALKESTDRSRLGILVYEPSYEN